MTAKTQIKNAAKKARQANPVAALAPKAAPAAKKTLAPSLAQLIKKEHSATLAEDKAAGNVFALFKSLLIALPLNDTVQVDLAKQAIIATYGEDQRDAAQLRVQLINNARKVEFGGKKDKVSIAGRGRAALLEVLDSVKSLRELKPKLAEAKPEGLKDSRGGSNKGAAKAAKAVKAPASTTMPTDRKSAFAAACDILKFVATFLQPGSDATLLGQLEEVEQGLRKAA